MIARPLPNDTTLEIVNGGSAPIGYVFCYEGSQGVTQEQRWVLYGGASLGPATLQRPADPARCCTSLEEWQRAVAEGVLWGERATYVKVNASSHSSRVDPEASAPPFPLMRRGMRRDGPVQMVDIQLTIFQDGVHVGDVYGTALSPIGDTGREGNREYWVMRREPDAGAPMSLSIVPKAGSVQEFLDATFIEGSTLTIASCTYFHELPETL